MKPGVDQAQAMNMLYRREIHHVGDPSITYDDQRQRSKEDAVVIERIPGFASVDVVFYTSLRPDIDLVLSELATVEEKAETLAELAMKSVTEETYQKGTDGIRYLTDAIRNGIKTPLTGPYRMVILQKAGNAPNLETARQWIAQGKGLLGEGVL